ncbi:DUF2878 domain-containing protein [Arenimonas daejeonensis]|uniref:DUF2878 domain-containing protein n=1 Tax=Arenimonas daejeonensis TaxID=370777 RepID=UPI0011BE8A63|nr:DUF2878 domain-containing protein [Arenimonas daejeonensis]
MRRVIANIVGNQCVWLCAVAGAGHGWAWPGVVAAAGYVLWQLAVAPHPRVEIRLVALALVVGLVVDGVAGSQGWLVYAVPQGVSWLAPVWILALWAAFAVMLTVSLKAFQTRLALASLLGGLGAPLAYLAAARGWGAVEFATPDWRGIAWLAFAWALALPLLLHAARTATAAAPDTGRSHAGAH